MARPLALFGVIAGILVGLLLWKLRGHEAAPVRPGSTSGSVVGAAAGASTAAAPASAKRRDHVTRLSSPEERRAIAERIAAAQAARVAQAASRPPELPAEDHGHDLERVAPRLKAAMGEAIPILAECYKTGAMTEKRPAVQLVLSGDDVSTLVDAQQMTDPSGVPIDGELESCLRTTLASLELPPLGNTEPIHLQYSFRFDEDEK